MAKQIDQPIKVRAGEELDTTQLSQYLQGLNPDWDAPIEVKQFPGGYSNLTYFLKVGNKELVLRRPPFGANVKSGHDMGREYKVQNLLKPVFDKVPEVYGHCTDDSVIGSEFYVMDRVQGVIVRGKGLTEGGEEIYPIMSQAWLDTFVELHEVDYEQAGLGDLGKPEGFNERQVKGWTKRYLKAKTDDVKVIEKVMEWLNSSIPTESDHTLIHNDYKYDNVMFAQDDWTKIVAILDWEMATLGDPLMDFGTTLAYWSEEEDLAVFGELISLPTYQAGNPNKAQLIDMYAERSGRDVSNVIYYYVYGLFKTAVIVQQIYYRYHHGYTQDKRFAALGKAAEGFCFKALRAIEKNRVTNLFS